MKVLVICPLRVGAVWKQEVVRWEHLHGLTISVAIGTAAERIAALTEDADIYVINRENLQWLIDKSGTYFEYDMVVLDELSSFKNCSISPDVAAFGEVGLSGEVRTVSQVSQRVSEAVRLGFKTIIVPATNLKEAQKTAKDKAEIIGVSNVKEASDRII